MRSLVYLHKNGIIEDWVQLPTKVEMDAYRKTLPNYVDIPRSTWKIFNNIIVTPTKGDLYVNTKIRKTVRNGIECL